MEAPDDDPGRVVRKPSQQIDWNLLRTFHSIVQANGITAAANSGSSKQSTISLALKRLEEIVGCRLCERGRAGFQLTDEGRILYGYVARVHDDIEEMHWALENSREYISGKLSIASISNFSSPDFNDIYLRYCQRYPEIIMDVDVLTWDNITKCIVNNDYDIGISPILYRHGDLGYHFLMTEYHNIYCGRQHRLFGEAPSIAALANETFILTGADEPDSLTSFRLRHGLGQKVTARTPSLEEARRLTVIGVGLCILPEQLVALDVANGLLWPLRERSEEMSCDVYIIANLRAPKRMAREAFIECALEITGR